MDDCEVGASARRAIRLCADNLGRLIAEWGDAVERDGRTTL